MPGVGAGVGEHRRRQRPQRPVGFLVLLIELHAHVLLEQRRQPDGRLGGELGGDAGVEQIDRAKSVVPVEHAQVVVGVVKRLFDGRVGEQRAERGEIGGGDGERVDERGLAPARDLDEIDAVAVAVEAGGFGVDTDARLAPHRADDLGERLGRGDVPRGGAHSSFPSASRPAAISSSALASVL